MAQRDRIPSSGKLREEWAKTDRPARKRIRRGVNRARAVEDPREAALAASLAAGQRRFWRWGWILGPIVVGVLTVPEGLEAVLVNVVVVTVAVGAMAVFFVHRAAKAEQLNRQVVEDATKTKSKRNRRKGKRI